MKGSKEGEGKGRIWEGRRGKERKGEKRREEKRKRKRKEWHASCVMRVCQRMQRRGRSEKGKNGKRWEEMGRDGKESVLTCITASWISRSNLLSL